MENKKIELAGSLDNNLLKSMGWKPTWESRIPLWPMRGKITGYKRKNRSPILGFEDILLSGIAVEYVSVPKNRICSEGSVFGRIEDHGSLYVWLYDQEIARKDVSPYTKGIGHPIVRFVTLDDDKKLQKDVSLSNLVLYQIGEKFWYPDISALHDRRHFQSYDTPSSERFDRYISALKMLVHQK